MSSRILFLYVFFLSVKCLQAQKTESSGIAMSGSDSLNHFRWYIFIHDENNPYNGYTKVEQFWRPNQILVYEWKLDEDTIYESDYTYAKFPVSCYLRKKTSDAELSLINKLAYAYVETHPDSFHIDTIRFLNGFDNPEIPKLPYKNWGYYYPNEFYVKRICSYLNNQKHGIEYTYFSFEELKGVRIGKQYMPKSKGEWKNGVKHGKWEEYSPAGKLIKRFRFKNGQLVKSTMFS